LHRARTLVLIAAIAALSWSAGFGSAKLGARTEPVPAAIVTVGHTADVAPTLETAGTRVHLEPQRPRGHGGGQVKTG
jgi:hypothetical protein